MEEKVEKSFSLEKPKVIHRTICNKCKNQLICPINLHIKKYNKRKRSSYKYDLDVHRCNRFD